MTLYAIADNVVLPVPGPGEMAGKENGGSLSLALGGGMFRYLLCECASFLRGKKRMAERKK